MRVTGLFHVLVTGNLPGSRYFFEQHFGLRSVFAADWYVQLAHPEQPDLQLGLVSAGHDSVPIGDQRPNLSGIVSIEVDDVDAAFGRLRDARVPLLGAPRDEPWGQRHFFAVEPGGFLVDVITSIQPTGEYANPGA